MKGLKLIASKGFMRAEINGQYVGSVNFLTEEDEENERTLVLIESADVEEQFQHKGIYTAMLKEYGKSFDEQTYFCSIGRSFDAANFWAKKLGMTIEETEGEIEKDEQERAFIITEDLELASNEYSPDLFDLFW